MKNFSDVPVTIADYRPSLVPPMLNTLALGATFAVTAYTTHKKDKNPNKTLKILATGLIATSATAVTLFKNNARSSMWVEQKGQTLTLRKGQEGKPAGTIRADQINQVFLTVTDGHPALSLSTVLPHLDVSTSMVIPTKLLKNNPSFVRKINQIIESPETLSNQKTKNYLNEIN